MATVKFKKILTSELATEAIEDGKLIWIKDGNNEIYQDVGTVRKQMISSDTALSTTSTNPIQNQALTNSIINTLEDVLATTVDSVPCGTQPLKLLSTIPSFSIATGDWSGSAGNYTATKTWTGLKTTYVLNSWMQSADPANTPPTATEIANEALYQYAVASATDTIKFRATAVPSATIVIRAEIVGV